MEMKSAERGEDWEVVDLLAQWYRPNFEGFMVSPTSREWVVRRKTDEVLSPAVSLRPCVSLAPANGGDVADNNFVRRHISAPKEVKSMYLVQLPKTSASSPFSLGCAWIDTD